MEALSTRPLLGLLRDNEPLCGPSFEALLSSLQCPAIFIVATHSQPTSQSPTNPPTRNYTTLTQDRSYQYKTSESEKVTSRGVNEASRNFTVIGEGPYITPSFWRLNGVIRHNIGTIVRKDYN